jgi:hypothetical protein
VLLRRVLVLCLVSLLVLPQRAFALIEAKLPLDVVIADSECIAVAKIVRFNETKSIAVVEISKEMKGKAPAERFSVDLVSDKPDLTQQLLARVDVGTQLVCFFAQKWQDKIPTGNFMCLIFTNGTWSNIGGEKTDNGIRWKFLHHEIYLRRTFKGTTEELQKVVVDVLAGKAKAPPLDNKEKPGLGPELMK